MIDEIEKMGASQSEFSGLIALAHDRSEQGRMKLAGTLADMFLAGTRELSAHEEELVNSLIDDLVGSAAAMVRRNLADRMARMPTAPRRAVISLACDKIEVSNAILKESQVLTDDDLIFIVDSQGRDHARAIAERQAVSEAVADALVVTGDPEVMRVLAENLGAKLTEKSMTIMADTARFTVALREPLMNRPELTADIATRLYWWVSQELRRNAIKRFGINSGQIDAALEQSIDDLLSHYELEKNDDRVMVQVADWLAEREAMSSRILVQVLRLGHFRLFNIMLARLSKLSLSLIDHVVAESGGRTLAALCRAIGIDKPNFVSVFLLSRGARPGEQIVHPRELSHALAAFDRINMETAKQLLQTWQKDSSYLTRNMVPPVTPENDDTVSFI